MSRVVGVILAGEGRRMKYQNKGLISLSAQPLIAHVIARISPQVDALYISANNDLEQYRAFNFPVFEDRSVWQGLGPLAGIATILRQLSDEDVIQVVSCDGPLIPDNLVSELRAARERVQTDVKVVYPETSERGHYLYLQGRVKDLREIESVLSENDLRIRALLARLKAKAVPFADENAFLNCNSLEDIEQLEEIIHEKL